MKQAMPRPAVRQLLPVAIVLVALAASATGAQAPASQRGLGGWWIADAERGGRTGRIALRFDLAADGGRTAAISLPTIDAWDVATLPVRDDGSRVVVGPWGLDRQPDGTLTGSLPDWLVPVYDVPVRFHAVERLERPAPVTFDAPRAEPVWALDLGTPVWAALAYAAGSLYVGGDDGALQRLDAASGRPRWSAPLGGAIRSRPTVVGERVYAFSDDGALHALATADGAEAWSVELTPGGVARVPPGSPGSRYDPYASAVTAAPGALFVGLHQGGVAALDPASGAERWRFEAAGAVTSTPTLAAGRLVFGSFDRNVYAIDAATGELLWKRDTGGAVPSTPLITGGMVVVGSRSYDLLGLDAASGERRWALYNWFSWVESSAVEADGVAYVGTSDAQRVLAIDPRSGALRWEADVGGSVWSAPAVAAELVVVGVVGVPDYIVEHRGALVALDRASGAVRWWVESARSEGGLWGYGASPAAGSGLIFAADLGGRVQAFRAE